MHLSIRGGTCHSLKRTQAYITAIPVREINLIAYLPLVQPTENSRPDLDLNPGHRRSSATQQVLWLRKRIRISPLSHGDRDTTQIYTLSVSDISFNYKFVAS